VFSPSETLNSPLAINLIFCQIVTDVFSPLCIRFSNEDRSRMKTILDEYSINLKTVFSNSHKLSTKKNIIEVAKDFPTYFSRLYPVSSTQSTDIQYLSISHSGVRLVRREKSLPTDYLRVLETYQYEDIGEVSTMSNSGLQMVMHTGGRVVLSANKAGQIRNMLNQYIVESNSGTYDYVKALAAFSSRDDGALAFKKGEVIAVVPKHDAYTEKGWLYGIKDGKYGLFPSDFVERMSPTAVRREMRMISKTGQNGAHGRNSTSPVDDRFARSKVKRNSAGDESEDGEEDREYHSHRNGHSKGVGSDSDEEGDRVPPIGLHGSDPDNLSEVSASAANVTNDGKHPLLEFALRYFRDVQLLMEGASSSEGGGGKKGQKNKKAKKGGGGGPDRAGSNEGDWLWKNQLDMEQWTDRMINNSLLGLEPLNVNKMALECFACVMRYMGDMPLLKNQHEVDCVNTIFLYCRQFETIRDEVYCQIMKQTTNNKSMNPGSCQRGWRLFSIIAAQFTSSELLKPYLFKYLETSAYDKRRAYHGTALVCLHNLRKTFKYGGRRNVPSIEEISAITAGRNSKRQIYRLPGGTERVINTNSTTVVDDVISELCKVIGIDTENEMEEFSLYCIVEGETFNVPLTKDHYILDVTTELQRDGAIYYLIFCRSIWHYPLRMDNTLYTEVVFNQIAPDYLEGLLLIMPGEQIDQNFVYDIAKIAALLHRAADMDHKPTIKETRFLLPKPALSARDIKPPQWVNMVQSSWDDGVSKLTTTLAKQKVLETLSVWPLFGSSFFAVRRVGEAKDNMGFEHIMALNKNGVSFLDQITHETLIHYPFTEVISTRKVQTEDGTLFLDMKCGNLMQQRITRIQTDQANEIARLIRQYITIDQRMKGIESGDKTEKDINGTDEEFHGDHDQVEKVASARNSEEKSHSPAR
jgi:myosin-15